MIFKQFKPMEGMSPPAAQISYLVSRRASTSPGLGPAGKEREAESRGREGGGLMDHNM